MWTWLTYDIVYSTQSGNGTHVSCTVNNYLSDTDMMTNFI